LAQTELQLIKQETISLKQDELITNLMKQRNEAYEELAKRSDAYPWYFWGVIGIASGVVITRGLR